MEKGRSMHDEIAAFLSENPQGVSSSLLAERFLKFKKPDIGMAQIAVKSILAGDKRFRMEEDSLWHFSTDALPTDRLRDVSWASIFVLTDPEKSRQRALHISIWRPGNQPECLLSEWLINPAELPSDEQTHLVDSADNHFDPSAIESLLFNIGEILRSHTAIFLCTYHHYVLYAECARAGILLSEDFIPVSELMHAANIHLQRPVTVESLSETLLGNARTNASARKQGQLFAQCTSELLVTMHNRGIITRTDLDVDDREERDQFFASKKFTYDDILSLPTTPGVYGFKNSEGVFIYIGKARNLKRRLMSYFRNTEESPTKLQQIRELAQELTTYTCGSELECLLYEFRLINRHNPQLNKQKEIRERPGVFTPINDCIVLLPHAESEKGMSFWFRRDQKIAIKPFESNFANQDTILKEIEEFFFSEKLHTVNSDFPEQEIAFRWIKAHRDNLTIVPVTRFSGAEETLEAMKSYWRDLQRAQDSLNPK